MKKITINPGRRLSVSSIVVGYLQENKAEQIAFEIPEEFKDYGRKACFEANGETFAKTFDNITGDTLTFTRDMTQYSNLRMTIAFFKVENEDEIVARTSTLDIKIENAVICDDDVKPDDPKIIILDNLITKVTQLDKTITKNEEIREANETTRQQNETTREENETSRVNSEANREKAEESRKKAESERVSNENIRKSNEEGRKVAENKRVSNENAREEYIHNLKEQVDNGDFNGADFNYKWDGTKLGVKNSKETTYQFVELKGQKGEKGEKGDTVTYKAGTDIEITEDNTINYIGSGGTGNVSSDVINSIVVVDSLPTTEVDGVLYLVKESGSSGETPSGTNIFTNYTSFIDYYLNSSGIIKSLTGGYSYYVSCEANTTYTVNGVGNKLRAGAFSSVPISGSTTTNFVTNDGGSTLNITTGADEIYLFVYLGTSDASLTEEQIIAGCTIIKN